MFETTKMSMDNLRDPDVNLENICGIIHELLSESNFSELSIEDDRLARKELAIILGSINNAINASPTLLDSSYIGKQLVEVQTNINKTINDIESLKEEDQKLDASIAQLKTELASLEGINKQYQAKLQQQAQLQKDINTLQNIDIDALNKQIAQLTNTKSQLEGQKNSLTATRNNLNNTITTLQNDNNTLTKNNQSLEQTINDLNKEKASIQKQIDANKVGKDKLEAEVKEMQEELDQMDKIPEELIDQSKQMKEELNFKKNRLHSILQFPEGFKSFFKKKVVKDNPEQYMNTIKQEYEMFNKTLDEIQLTGMRLKKEYKEGPKDDK